MCAMRPTLAYLNSLQRRHCHKARDTRAYITSSYYPSPASDDNPCPFLLLAAPARLSLGMWESGAVSSLEVELSSSSLLSSFATNGDFTLRLGVFLKSRSAAFDLEKRISWLAICESRLNGTPSGVDLIGVFFGSKEVVAFSDSFSDPDADGEARVLGA